MTSTRENFHIAYVANIRPAILGGRVRRRKCNHLDSQQKCFLVFGICNEAAAVMVATAVAKTWLASENLRSTCIFLWTYAIECANRVCGGEWNGKHKFSEVKCCKNMCDLKFVSSDEQSNCYLVSEQLFSLFFFSDISIQMWPQKLIGNVTVVSTCLPKSLYDHNESW